MGHGEERWRENSSEARILQNWMDLSTINLQTRKQPYKLKLKFAEGY